jgi:subtilisin family serine protease
VTRSTKRAATVLAATLAVGAIGPLSGTAAVLAGGAPEPLSQVTLITGDRVTVLDGGLQVTPAARAQPVVFQDYTRHGDRYLVPADAGRLIQSGRLDKELFNITGLLRQGYDDAHTPNVPLLVQSTDAKTPAGAKVRRTLPRLNTAAMDTPKADATATWNGLAARTRSGDVQKIWLNGKVSATLDESVPQIGAPAAWQAGYSGTGVQVAVLDTGIDTDHPDLAGKVVQSKDFSGKGSVEDGFGHGTHVASTITGSGAASGGRYKGVAPGVKLAVGKVLDDNGQGTDDMILEGMQWAAADAHAKIVNMSLGGGPSDGTDPLSTAVNTLSSQYGTLFVIAAGNFGQDSSVSAPGAADAALTVGSVSKQDEPSPFSSRGPRPGDGALKPEIAAPGGAIVAARPGGVEPIGEPVGDAYQRLDGTSMATPHVAGAAAILAQAHPSWSWDKLKAGLASSAKDIGAGPYAVGAGRLDVARAVSTPVIATGSVSTLLPWPNQGAQKKQTVTWTSTADAPVTFALQTNLSDRVTLSADSVTVPAGGSASVELTVTAKDNQPGTFGGVLTARTADGAISTRTALSVYQQEETHTIDLKLVDRDGAQVTEGDVTIINLDNGDVSFGTPGAIQLPRGRYAVNAGITTPRPGQEPSVTLISHPELLLDHDITQVMDARAGQPVSAEPDNATAHGGNQGMQAFNKVVACQCTYSGFVQVDPRFQQTFAATVPGTRSDNFAFGQERRATEAALELTANDGQPFAVQADWLETATTAENVTLGAVHGGTGTPEDLAKIDAHDKLVVVDLPASSSHDVLLERVANIRNAGGRLALVHFGEDAAGLAQSVQGGTASFALPTLYSYRSVTADRFARYVKAGNASVTYVNRPAPNFRYELAYGVEKELTSAQVYRPKTQDLVAVRTAYHDNVPGAVRYWAGREFFGHKLATGSLMPAAAQQERTEYYTPGTWSMMWSSARRGTLEEDKVQLVAGRPCRIAWNKAVAGPSLRGLTQVYVGEAPRPFAWRKNGRLDAWPAMYGDAAGRPRGQDAFLGDAGTISLYQDGTLLTTGPVTQPALVPLPDQAATYRLAAEVHRSDANWTLSTKVSSTWTFRSSAAAEGKAFPLLTARFDPGVNLHNQAPGGVAFSFPAYVERQDGASKVTTFTVDVSYDDGKNWQAAKVVRDGDHWTVSVRHPLSGYASLRAWATDSEGNTVEQTVVRAYQIGG